MLLVIAVLESRRGLNYSVFRTAFWFISILCYSFLFRTRVNELSDDIEDYIPNFVFFYLNYSLIVISFFLEFLPNKKASSLLKDNKKYPEKVYNYIS